MRGGHGVGGDRSHLMSSLMRSEWGPNWQGCVNRQLAEECLYKRTHGETVLEMRPSLFTTSTPKLKKRTEERMRERKGGGGGVGHATTERSGVEIDKTEREEER